MNAAQLPLDRIVGEIDTRGFRAHGVHVLVGDDTAEHRWAPDVREDIHSVAKGVCALAILRAADERLLSLETPVSRYLPNVEFGEGSDSITLRHLLTMTSGIDLPWSPTLMTDWPDLALEFLGRPSRGRVFQYSNASTYTAMRVLAQVVGDAADYVDRVVLHPLGITDAAWERCPRGYPAAGGGLALRTEELARVGRLIRDRGRWQGRTLVSAEGVAKMHSDWVAAGTGPGYERYAFAGWDGPGAGWRLHGAHGQMIAFTPDAVITIAADDHEGADGLLGFLMP
ncbi:serine hydrolase domain-containing protein [Herbiconiux sp. A18JL235]|uniref:Serine hydrolase domain-containing protein n=1 Tax=Herbiconiux sp. A18JL235 TaxID=3152363 RepID=A0AB39BGT3_9MICO